MHSFLVKQREGFTFLSLISADLVFPRFSFICALIEYPLVYQILQGPRPFPPVKSLVLFKKKRKNAFCVHLQVFVLAIKKISILVYWCLITLKSLKNLFEPISLFLCVVLGK